MLFELKSRFDTFKSMRLSALDQSGLDFVKTKTKTKKTIV